MDHNRAPVISTAEVSHERLTERAHRSAFGDVGADRRQQVVIVVHERAVQVQQDAPVHEGQLR
jgi:hypothetical protein